MSRHRTPRNLRERLIWARQTAGFSQRKLARVASLGSERHVCFIESGDRKNLTLETITALAQALDISVGWLAAGEGDEPTEKHLREIGQAKGAA